MYHREIKPPIMCKTMRGPNNGNNEMLTWDVSAALPKMAIISTVPYSFSNVEACVVYVCVWDRGRLRAASLPSPPPQ